MSIEELGLKDQAQPVRLAHIQIGDKLIRLREAFDTLDSAGKTEKTGKLSLSEIRMAFRIHVHRDLTNTDLQAEMEIGLFSGLSNFLLKNLIGRKAKYP